MKRNIALLLEEAVNGIDRLNGDLRFTRDEQLFLCEHFEPVELRKYELLTRQGKVEDYLYFVEEGILRYWLPDGEEREITLRFAFEGDFAGAYHSLKTGEPSAYHIEALEATRLWRLPVKELSGALSHSLNLNRALRLFFEGLAGAQEMRMDYLMRLSPENRYQQLLVRERRVVLSVALKHIASYLGIAPQTLSRIRRK